MGWSTRSDETDDPTTWIVPWRPDEETSEAEGNCKIGYTWKYREPANEEWLVRMTVGHPIIVGWAEQLLGSAKFNVPERVRGIYSVYQWATRRNSLWFVTATSVLTDSLRKTAETGYQCRGANCADSAPWRSIHRLAGHA